MEAALALSTGPHAAALPQAARRQPTDGELIERVGGGDRPAFDELYRRYARALYGFALRRLGDRERAEDAVQEAWASIWRSSRTFDPGRGRAASWLYAVARNAAVDRFRGRGEPASEPVERASPDAGPPERAEAAWAAWRIHRALEELPRSERDVVELAYWSGLSQNEVADYLGVPLGTVKTRTRRALARLADALALEDLR